MVGMWPTWLLDKQVMRLFTGRNEVVAKVMFLLVSVILSTGGGSASVHAGIPHPPRADPPGSRHPRRRTVNERPVRILLECILVEGDSS